MKFKSQVHTTLEQSKRLVALGLKKETADCCHYYVAGVTDEEIPENANYSAWSLHRLIVMVADTPLQVGSQVGMYVEDTYNMVIQGIEWLISRGQFNKDYLEEKK